MHRLVLFSCLSLSAATLPAQFTGFWEARPSLAIARQEVGVAVLAGKLYVAGGILANRQGSAAVEVFDPATERWTRIADMPLRLHHHGICAVGNKLYQIGGYVDGTFTPTVQCHSWDPVTGLWTRIADLPFARGGSVAVAIGRKIYIAGGVEQTEGVSNTLAIYDVATNRWSSGARMSFRREHLAAAALGGKLHVVGGRRGGALYSFHERYDPATNTWTTLAAMPTARGGNAAAAFDGRLIVVGGEAFSPSRVFRETEEYDPATNTWRRLRDMMLPVHGIQVAQLGADLLVAGGGVRAGFSTTAAVTAFRDLPSGVVAYGTSAAACRGAIVLSVNEAPKPGARSFAFVSSAYAPPSTAALLLLSGSQDRGGTALLGARLHVGLQPLITIGAATDVAGAMAVPIAIPFSARGWRVFVQSVFVNTQSCTNGQLLSSSRALDVTIL